MLRAKSHKWKSWAPLSVKRIAWKLALVLLLTVAVFVMLASSGGEGPAIGGLEVIDMIEIFVAVPALTLAYYWLIEEKVGGFENRLMKIEKTFEMLEKELELEEKELEEEESTLKEDIRELKKMIGELDEKVVSIKK